MLARFFSRPQINHPIVLVVMAIVLMSWTLIWVPFHVQTFDLWGSTHTVSGIGGYIIGGVIWILIALFWQFLGKQHQLVQDHYFWPVMIVILGLVFLPSPNYLTFTQHFSGFALLAGMFIHRRDGQQTYFSMFDLGLFIGLWALFAPLSILWIVLMWIGLLVFGFPPLRSFILLLSGAFITLFLTATIIQTIIFVGGEANSMQALYGQLRLEAFDTPAYIGIALALLLLYIAPEIYRSVTRSSVLKRQLSGWGIICLLLLVPTLGFLGLRPEFTAPLILFSSLFLANRFAFNKSKRRELVFYLFLMLVLIYPVAVYFFIASSSTIVY